MRLTVITTIAALGLAMGSAAHADDMKPVTSHGINLGGIAGDAYYTVRQDGYHVVATFSQRDASGTPVRVQAVLSPGQAVTFSSPRGVGEQPVSMSITRRGEHVIVNEAAVTN